MSSGDSGSVRNAAGNTVLSIPLVDARTSAESAALVAFPGAFSGNVNVSGGPAPARAYVEELLPDVLEGRIEPGRVFDRTVGLDEVPDGYRAMNDREAIKVMVEV